MLTLSGFLNSLTVSFLEAESLTEPGACQFFMAESSYLCIANAGITAMHYLFAWVLGI